MINLNAPLDKETLAKVREKRQEAQKTLAYQIRRMKIHQKIYDSVKVDYSSALARYKKLDMIYAMNEKLTKVPAKRVRKSYNSSKNGRNVMPAKVKKLLKDLPEDARNRIISAYENC